MSLRFPDSAVGAVVLVLTFWLAAWSLYDIAFESGATSVAVETRRTCPNHPGEKLVAVHYQQGELLACYYIDAPKLYGKAVRKVPA